MKTLKIMLSCLLLCILCACGGQKEYIRNTTPGTYIEISFAQLCEKVENDETFMAIVSQTRCDHCNEYKENVLNPYMETHHLNVYEVNLTNEEVPKETFTDLQNYTAELTPVDAKHFMGTPYTMVVEKGELKEGISGGIRSEDLDSVVVMYQLDKVK